MLSDAVNLGSPMAPGHPLNRGRVLWLAGLPNPYTGGQRWRDATPWKRDGTLVNGPTWTPTPYGWGLSFTAASSQYVATGLKWTFGSRVTCGAWARSTSAANTAGYVLNVNYNGSTVPFDLNLTAPPGTTGHGFGFFDGNWRKSGVTTNVLGDGRWHRVVGTYDGSTLCYYLDGRLDASSSYSGSISTTNANPLDVGRYGAGGWYFAGDIADPFVSAVTWTAAEVWADYQFSRQRYAGSGVLNTVGRRAWAAAAAGGGIAPRAWHNRMMQGIC